MPNAASWEALMGMPSGTATTRVVRFGNAGNGFTITMSSGSPMQGVSGSAMYGGPMGMPMGGGDLHSLLQHIRLMLEQSGYGTLPSNGHNPKPCASHVRRVATGDLVEGPNGQAMSMDALMSQIMQQYQPQFVPTAPDARESLPRRTVGARRASSKALVVGTTADTPPPVEPGLEQAREQPTHEGMDEDGKAAARVGDTCTVCHDDYEEGATVVELPCMHCFHEDCIMPWLETHNTCPVCRKELPADPNAPAVQPERPAGPPSLTQMLQGLTGMGGQPGGGGGQQQESAGCVVM